MTFFYVLPLDKRKDWLYYCINNLVQQYNDTMRIEERRLVMAWDIKSDRPVYAQLIEQIQQKIICGEYQLGGKLPSVRDLATEAAVNPNTMQKALSELERTGLLYSQRTSGRFITEDKELIMMMRESIAKEQIKEFVTQMEKLGFSLEEICDMVRKVEKEMLA